MLPQQLCFLPNYLHSCAPYNETLISNLQMNSFKFKALVPGKELNYLFHLMDESMSLSRMIVTCLEFFCAICKCGAIYLFLLSTLSYLLKQIQLFFKPILQRHQSRRYLMNI